ncbi:MAG TPA: hypothetical protein VFS43_24940 [Polyangiaceae bacterium]|nr:hypothetical protein [Polyangiaceae bacterium]
MFETPSLPVLSLSLLAGALLAGCGAGSSDRPGEVGGPSEAGELGGPDEPPSASLELNWPDRFVRYVEPDYPCIGGGSLAVEVDRGDLVAFIGAVRDLGRVAPAGR